MCSLEECRRPRSHPVDFVLRMVLKERSGFSRTGDKSGQSLAFSTHINVPNFMGLLLKLLLAYAVSTRKKTVQKY